jgi:hypothetical protein
MVRARAVRVSRETSLAIINERDQQRTVTLKKVLLCTSPTSFPKRKGKKKKKERKSILMNFYSEAWGLVKGQC